MLVERSENMAVLNRDEYLNRIRTRLGEELTDDDIALMEDMIDTFDDFNTKLTDSTDWKSKYEENDKAWRQKYIDRFTGASETGVDFVENPSGSNTNEKEEDEYLGMLSYDDLFKGV